MKPSHGDDPPAPPPSHLAPALIPADFAGKLQRALVSLGREQVDLRARIEGLERHAKRAIFARWFFKYFATGGTLGFAIYFLNSPIPSMLQGDSSDGADNSLLVVVLALIASTVAMALVSQASDIVRALRGKEDN